MNGDVVFVGFLSLFCFFAGVSFRTENVAIDESEAVEGLLKQKKKISSKNLNETLLHRSKTSINNEREREGPWRRETFGRIDAKYGEGFFFCSNFQRQALNETGRSAKRRRGFFFLSLFIFFLLPNETAGGALPALILDRVPPY